MNRGVLIIGLGQIGMEFDFDISDNKFVYSHSRAFSLHPSFQLIGGVDSCVLKCKKFSEKYLLPSFNSIPLALSKLMPQIVVIAAPTKYHKTILFEILENDNCLPEAILCEKPLSYTEEEAAQMINFCVNKKVKLYVNYMRRSDPGAIRIKNMIDSGEMGKWIKGVAWYSKGLIHNGSHFINLLEFWLGPCKDSKIINNGRLWQNNDPEPDVYIEFEKGSVVFMSAKEECYSHYSIELICEYGRIRYEKGGELILLEKTTSDQNFPSYFVLNGSPEIIINNMERYQLNVVEQLFKELSGDDGSICRGNDALETVRQTTKIVNKLNI